MFKDNPLLAQLKAEIRENLKTVEGQIKASDKGFGFLDVDGKESYFVPPPYMKKVIHGDKVKAVVRSEKDKEVAEPESLLEPSLTRFVGRIKQRDDRQYVVPDHPLIKDSIRCRPAKGLKVELAQGDWVVAELKRHPLKGDNGFSADILEKVADNNDGYAPWHVTLARHNLQKAAPQFDGELTLIDGLERQDLSHIPFATIDAASTQDMDDAIWVEKVEGGYQLWVAIADPTAYVVAGSDLDQAAELRAFTVYLPGRNVTMLPEVLSDDLCSLKAGEKRPALVARTFVADDGTLGEDTEFTPAWIESRQKLVYNNVSDWLEGKDGWQPDDEAQAATLKLLRDFTEARTAWRQAHALVFGDRPDYRFELDQDGNVVTVHREERRIANRIVEEAMIAANVACGQYLRRHGGIGVYNVHNGFEDEKLEDAKALLAQYEVPVDIDQVHTLEGYAAMRRWLDAEKKQFLDGRLRRFQSYAAITLEAGPHYGLGLPAYATWTSPIRKYGDMVNHRIIKAILQGEQVAKPKESLAEHLSEHRRLNRLAERDMGDWLYVRWLGPEAGTETRFDAEIIDVNRGGMKVRLVDNGAVAFVPASQIHDVKAELDVNFEAGTILIKGEESYKLADLIQVQLTEANEDTRSLVAKPAK
ncbi:exoribonuclease II [Gallaecimonas kandeliae]|uniref:exoribonuclease II n=1 Tax=Gallaecimonas kandeliae TaxID=3029055 RepID=UPI0026476C57|nr:exoribonuclease II [Gallaecimonas kandeliae]WKE64025.1 exoribonuclease II [Gallaecimonas kandeliae]